MTQRIALTVDDVGANREFLERLLTGAKFEVLSAATGGEAFSLIEKVDELPLAVVDMKLPDMSGLQLIGHLRQKYPKSYLVIASMYDERSKMVAAFDIGCNAYLVKPNGFMELFQRLMTVELDALREDQPLIVDQYGARHFKGTTGLFPKVTV
jgi:CheY-like chemotaxis protein